MERRLLVTLLPLTVLAARDVQETVLTVQKRAPELFIGAADIARRDGYMLETHTVQTSDGYILDIHRIPGKGPPVYLQHGFLCASHLWMLEGPGSALAYMLADKGYDVWMGNVRGNTYAKRHVSMDSRNLTFWNFSWHEMGLYDLPACVDHVLKTTGHQKLFYVGHSMGNTMAYVMLTLRPEYNAKVRMFMNLAPAVMMSQTRSSFVRFLVPYIDSIVTATEMSHLPEILPISSLRAAMGYLMCRDGVNSQALCVQFLHLTYGYSNGMNKTKIPYFLAHLTMGASSKTAGHFVQIVGSGTFRHMDHGPERNMELYRSLQPPIYNLSLVTTPVVLAYSDGDVVVDSHDVRRLAKYLPQAKLYRVPSKQFNHIDYCLHRHVRSLVNDYVLEMMSKY